MAISWRFGVLPGYFAGPWTCRGWGKLSRDIVALVKLTDGIALQVLAWTSLCCLLVIASVLGVELNYHGSWC